MTTEPALGEDRRPQRATLWLTLALLVIIVVAVGIHFGTDLRAMDSIRDEAKMMVPITDILERGWNVDTMIDYQEVKGPTFYWSYAAAAELLGGTINAMRFTTLLFFIGSAIPLLLIARRCVQNAAELFTIGVFYLLVPYAAPQGQLLMSETSFIFFATVLMWVFVWGFGAGSKREHRLAGPVLFAVVLSALLHHRPHAVAFAGAAALVAFERDRWRSWPWWLACVLAGLSRLPLWARWGGMVTSDYQDLFGLGFRLDGLTYMLAALVPSTAILIWPVVHDRAYRSRRWLLIAGGAAGVALGLLAAPDLDAKVAYYNPSIGEAAQQGEYLGTVSTMIRTLFAAHWMQTAALAALAGLGGASMGAFAAVAWRPTVRRVDGVVYRLAFWTLGAGMPLYVITKGPVYDRYLLVWSVLLPIVWGRALSRPAQIVQALLLAAMGAYFINQYFV